VGLRQPNLQELAINRCSLGGRIPSHVEGLHTSTSTHVYQGGGRGTPFGLLVEARVKDTREMSNVLNRSLNLLGLNYCVVRSPWR
jgi:hypothetical protein